ncbi:unnamed protein product, partial [Ectocarpus fasciculatus]
LQILAAQTSSTEVRGGQAGGISSFDHRQGGPVIVTRSRYVARKRYPLAADLIKVYKADAKVLPEKTSDVTFIGHTRFATSSVNLVSELHPHEWAPFRDEEVWGVDDSGARYCHDVVRTVGIHISHNGDFDALEAYGGSIVNAELGCWLERILHVKNDLAGDSVKIAGCFDLMRVKGRWGAAARLAFVRLLKSPSDVSGGEPLAKDAPATFPLVSYFEQWGQVFNEVWEEHVSNVIKFVPGFNGFYRLDVKAERQLVSSIVERISSAADEALLSGGLNLIQWTASNIQAFVHFTVRGFLRSDSYTVMTEFLSRADGSFGIQVHSTLEPGSVVISSKGQPMSLSYDPDLAMCLFGSEASAVAVPVESTGTWLCNRLDLDSKGEVTRIGLQILSYSLVSAREYDAFELLERASSIDSAPIPYDPKVDLVGGDLAMTPAIIQAIENAWSNESSIEYISAQSLAEHLIKCMRHRITTNSDSTDLLIGGVEASLWVAEQWAADLRAIFPHLNVVTVSSNKLLGLTSNNAGKVFFPGADTILRRRIDEHTCVLLISQSGQTFPTLHATRSIASLVGNRLWLMTGCFASKMELAMLEEYKNNGIPYMKDRVFNNYSGMRPAEPSSVAVAATFHSLTRLIMSASQHVRNVGHLDVGGITLMNLSDGDIEDLHEMTSSNLLSGLMDIVGFDETGNPRESPLHNELVRRGEVWAEHIKESWTVLLLVGVYFILSIGLGVTFFYSLRFSLLNTHQFSHQPIGWTLVGLLLQIMDALLFGYLVKLFTLGCRYFGGRPLWARIGKRTLVIVDTPMNHQLLENFVSKLFSQSYSFVSIDVHGASGLDHFVHRFTHRVVRGVLLAVGRPDGRMSTLAKSESSILLAVKQAAFIQNPSYNGGAGSGVDIVTIGHNPFSPSMGKTTANIYLPSAHRQKFVDEYIYERLFLATKPFSGGILQSLSRKYKTRGELIGRMASRAIELKEFKDILIYRDLSTAEARRESFLLHAEDDDLTTLASMKHLPFGCGHINPRYRGNDLLKDFIMSIPKDLMPALKKRVQEHDDINEEDESLIQGAVAVGQLDDTGTRISTDFKSENRSDDGRGGKPSRPGLSGSSNDPGVRLAFNHSLDHETQKVESSLGPEQTFYECRIAAIERYISFCVMFHSMAKACHDPLFRLPWDIARSQSNLRVATTASPISAVD